MTKEQLQRRLDKAVLHIDRTKEFKSCYFADRGLRITVEEDVALVGRQSYVLMFEKVVAGGYSRIYMLLSNMVDMANRYDCTAKDAKGEQYMSYYKLREILSGDAGAKIDYNVFVIFTAWFDVLQSTLFLSPESPEEMFALNGIYALNTIVHGAVSKPYEKDMTSNELWGEIQKDISEYVGSMGDDYVVLKHKTDEEKEKELSEVLNEMQIDEQTVMEGVEDEGEDKEA